MQLDPYVNRSQSIAKPRLLLTHSLTLGAEQQPSYYNGPQCYVGLITIIHGVPEAYWSEYSIHVFTALGYQSRLDLGECYKEWTLQNNTICHGCRSLRCPCFALVPPRNGSHRRSCDHRLFNRWNWIIFLFVISYFASAEIRSLLWRICSSRVQSLCHFTENWNHCRFWR